MDDGISRRHALKRMAGLVGTGAVVSHQAKAASEAPSLDPNESMAKPFGYHLKAASVDGKQFPTYKSGQRCGTCQLYQGQAGQASGPCNLFPRHVVNADGWCRVWVAKSS